MDRERFFQIYDGYWDLRNSGADESRLMEYLSSQGTSLEEMRAEQSKVFGPIAQADTVPSLKESSKGVAAGARLSPGLASTAAARGVAQGLSFGFADELAAGLRALSPNRTYKEEVEKSRARDRAARESNPAAYYTGEFASALVPGLGALGAGARAANWMGRLGTIGRAAAAPLRAITPATTRAGMVAKGSLLGAGQGALYAAGQSEEEGLERAPYAITGGLLGGAFGAAVPMIGGVARGAWNTIGRQSGRPGANKREAARAMSRLLEEAEIDPSQPLPLRSAFGLNETVGDVMREQGEETMMGLTQILGGRNVGKMRAAMNDVQARVPEVARNAVDNLAGSAIDPDTYRSGMARQRVQMVDDLMNYARANTPRNIESDARIQRIKKDERFPEVRQLLEYAKQKGDEIIAARGSGPALPGEEAYTTSLGRLDFVRQQLDDLAEQAKQGKIISPFLPSQPRVDAKRYADLASRWRNALRSIDRIPKEFGEALDTHKMYSRAEEALDLGLQFKNKNPTSMENAFRDWVSDGNTIAVDSFRKGVLSRVQEILAPDLKAAKGSANVVKDMIKRVSFAFSPDELDEINTFLDIAYRQARVSNRMVNASQTAQNAAAAYNMSTLGSAAQNLISGQPFRAAGQMAGLGIRVGGRGHISPRAGEQMIDWLLSTDAAPMLRDVKNVRELDQLLRTLGVVGGIQGGLLGGKAAGGLLSGN